MFDSLANSEDDGVPFKDAYHVGKVVMNEDPECVQRIKVSVPGYLEGSADTLPWVGPIHPSSFGGSADHGVVRVPVIGSLVVVRFQNGDIQQGLYVGYVPTINFAKNMPAALKTNYPNRVGYIDPMGTVVFTDVSTGEMTINHFTGGVYRIEASGPMLTIISDIDITGNIHLKGNITMEGNTTQMGNVTLTGNTTQMGNVTLTGNTVQTGNVALVGNLVASGMITGTGGLATPGPLAASSGLVGGVRLELHTHVDSKGGSTSGPVPSGA